MASKELEEIIELEHNLNVEISIAIAKVLKEYGIGGDFIFSVRKDSDYGLKPINELKGKTLKLPIYAMGSGYANVNNPSQVKPI